MRVLWQGLKSVIPTGNASYVAMLSQLVMLLMLLLAISMRYYLLVIRKDEDLQIEVVKFFQTLYSEFPDSITTLPSCSFPKLGPNDEILLGRGISNEGIKITLFDMALLKASVSPNKLMFNPLSIGYEDNCEQVQGGFFSQNHHFRTNKFYYWKEHHQQYHSCPRSYSFHEE
ncbi:hypothetical protein J1N35_038085 [Gossypium stocksii]|uniref:Uncharacterized protein n=1 Tax=Gossypium stocksii TaxID=47602 RepID=A0A9D3UL85_9ROSI|nr:hypothetical protein J1N35_038085 [Gossypium stocksii]